MGSAMENDDEYRKRAAEAQSQADRTVSAVDKASWLNIAQGYRDLIRKPKKPDTSSDN
jgi:hypothetical protein